MAELAEGDGGKELRVLSGAVFDAGGLPWAYRRLGINI